MINVPNSVGSVTIIKCDKKYNYSNVMIIKCGFCSK